MKDMQIKNITAQETLALRQRVLWPNKPTEYCIVEGDDHANHYGLFVAAVLAGVASTYDNEGAVRLRKFAVDTSHQGVGLGSALLKHAISQAALHGASVFWCDARESAVQFYERFGLSIEGSRFYKSNLPYYSMSITLTL